jgi:membrane fusion protein (multidrug efflux system)
LDNDQQTIANERSQAALETERSEFERIERLFKQELVSEEAFETGRRELQDLEHAARLAELELSRTVILAPFAGVVLSRQLDVGNTVTAGTAVYQLADMDPLFADVNVPERQVARLGKGQKVLLTLDAGGQEIVARIERIAPAVDVQTGTVKVTLAVPAIPSLRPGSFVKVDIVTDTRAAALVVPRSALVAEGRRWFLYRVAEDGKKVAQIEVELGYEGADRVQVLPLAETATGESSGAMVLGFGQKVVVAGAGALSDGALIEIATPTIEPEVAADVHS